MKIRCATLFDITQTGVNHRRSKLEKNDEVDIAGSQQSNFETILQCIGIRAQPEEITSPIKKQQQLKNFGIKYKTNNNTAVWTFTFTVNQSGVFQVGEQELDGLYQDCESVPMIVGLEESKLIQERLNTSKEYKNIHFEIIDE